MMSWHKIILSVTVSLVILILTLLLAPLVSHHGIEFSPSIFMEGSEEHLIIFKIRIPRVLLGALAGGTLTLAGLILQALLKNPLASPFTLGIASGGALGAAIAIYAGLNFLILGIHTLPLFAITGSLVIMLFLYLLSLRQRRLSTEALLLAGVTLSISASSLIMLFQYLSDYTQTVSIVRWLMGSLDIIDYKDLLLVFPFSLLGLLFLFFKSPDVNLMTFGDEFAFSKGVEVNRLKKQLFFLASIMTGAVVAITGPIGFVGLIIPHLVRLIVGADHRITIPVSFFFGASFLVWCDTIARIIIYPAELPVGVITSLLGGPFFIILLIVKFK